MAHDIIDLSDGNIHRIANILQSLSLLTTTSLLDEREENPDQGRGFVTVPAVEAHFGTARQNSGAVVIAYLPTVLPSEVDAWNQYSNEKQGWIQESLSTVNVTDSILPSIWTNSMDDFTADGSTCGVPGRRKLMSEEARSQRVPVEPDAGPFSPVWTFSPPPRAEDVGIVNFDFRLNPIFRNAVDYISSTKLPTFLDVCNHASLFDNHDYAGDSLQTAIAFPVFDGYDRETSNVVGHLIAIIPWVVFYQNILLHGSPPIVTVHENTCHQVFTFEIQGHEGELLAENDLHNKEFEHMVITSSYSHLDDHHEFYGDVGGDTHGDGDTHEDEHDDEHEHASTHSEEIDNRTCHYTIAVYPTKAFQETYVTSDPIWFAFVVLGVFFVTSLIFAVFDRFVRKRTEKVMSVALKQNAIVSSLFPKSVQAKLMAEADQNERLGRLGKAGIKSFLSADKESGDMNKDAIAASSKPIAGAYTSIVGESVYIEVYL
jgi:hypothetical protein